MKEKDLIEYLKSKGANPRFIPHVIDRLRNKLSSNRHFAYDFSKLRATIKDGHVFRFAFNAKRRFPDADHGDEARLVYSVKYVRDDYTRYGVTWEKAH
jgi:hypothetical protein